MTKVNYKKATFLLSVANLSQLPPDEGAEVAFIGRSNAGKSSVLNQLTQNKRLARVSKTPGRTQHINLFEIDAKRRIADLPGYGYAKVPPKLKEQWQRLIDSYLRHRACLKGLVLVMDIRHPLKEFDQHMLAWGAESEIPIHILLNKADKLTLNHIKKTVMEVTKNIAQFGPNLSMQAFSAESGDGLDDLKNILDHWLS